LLFPRATVSGIFKELDAGLNPYLSLRADGIDPVAHDDGRLAGDSNR